MSDGPVLYFIKNRGFTDKKGRKMLANGVIDSDAYYARKAK